MDVNLRKAYAYSKALITAAQKSDLSSTARLSVFAANDGLVTLYDEAVLALQRRTEAAQNYLTAAYAIRAKIAEQDARVGINLRLTSRALLDAEEKLIAGLKTANDEPHSALQQKADAARKRLHEYGYSSEHVDAGINTGYFADNISQRLKTIQREKVKLNDEIDELNRTTKITLSDAEESALHAIGLI